ATHADAKLHRGAQERLQKRVMELLGNSSALFQAHILFSYPLFFLFTRFNFCSARVPPSDASLFYQWVVTKQEPSVDAILSEQSCAEFERITPGKGMLPFGSHLLGIVWMNDPADYVH